MEGMSRVSEKRVWGMKSGWWEKPFHMDIYLKVYQQVLSAEDGVSRCLQGSILVSKENAVVVIQWILQRSLWCSDRIWMCCLGAEDWQGDWEGCKFLFSSKLKFFWGLFLRLCNHFFTDLSPAIQAEWSIMSQSLLWLIIRVKPTLQAQRNWDHCVVTWKLARSAAETLSKCAACEQVSAWIYKVIKKDESWIWSQKHTFHWG